MINEICSNEKGIGLKGNGKKGRKEKCQIGFNYVMVVTLRETIVFRSMWWKCMMKYARVAKKVDRPMYSPPLSE